MKKTVILMMVLAVSMSAQTAQRAIDYAPPGPVPCPHPISSVIQANTQPPAPDAADFGALQNDVATSQWNQTVMDKKFGTSFHFVSPGTGKDCCIMTSGTLRVTLRALATSAFGSSSTGNDGVNIFSGGQSVVAVTPWPSGSTAGGTTTLNINIPANVLAQGHFGLYVQDDTAVVSAELSLKGCCLK